MMNQQRNEKERTIAIQQIAMDIVEIEPMSEEANRLIDQTMKELNLTTRHLSFQVLRDSGKLDDAEIGGEILNHAESIAALIEKFSCTRETARRHVAQAAKRKRHPDWAPPQHGGARLGAGRKKTEIDCLDRYDRR